MKRLMLRIPAQTHTQLKIVAAAQDKTIQELVTELVENHIRRYAREVSKAMGGEK